MDPVTAVCNVLTAWITFLGTPEGQKICEQNRELIAKFTATLDALVAKHAPS